MTLFPVKHCLLAKVFNNNDLMFIFFLTTCNLKPPEQVDKIEDEQLLP